MDGLRHRAVTPWVPVESDIRRAGPGGGHGRLGGSGVHGGRGVEPPGFSLPPDAVEGLVQGGRGQPGHHGPHPGRLPVGAPRPGLHRCHLLGGTHLAGLVVSRRNPDRSERCRHLSALALSPDQFPLCRLFRGIPLPGRAFGRRRAAGPALRASVSLDRVGAGASGRDLRRGPCRLCLATGLFPAGGTDPPLPDVRGGLPALRADPGDHRTLRLQCGVDVHAGVHFLVSRHVVFPAVGRAFHLVAGLDRAVPQGADGRCGRQVARALQHGLESPAPAGQGGGSQLPRDRRRVHASQTGHGPAGRRSRRPGGLGIRDGFPDPRSPAGNGPGACRKRCPKSHGAGRLPNGDSVESHQRTFDRGESSRCLRLAQERRGHLCPAAGKLSRSSALAGQLYPVRRYAGATQRALRDRYRSKRPALQVSSHIA